MIKAANAGLKRGRRCNRRFCQRCTCIQSTRQRRLLIIELLIEPLYELRITLQTLERFVELDLQGLVEHIDLLQLIFKTVLVNVQLPDFAALGRYLRQLVLEQLLLLLDEGIFALQHLSVLLFHGDDLFLVSALLFLEGLDVFVAFLHLFLAVLYFFLELFANLSEGFDFNVLGVLLLLETLDVAFEIGDCRVTIFEFALQTLVL